MYYLNQLQTKPLSLARVRVSSSFKLYRRLFVLFKPWRQVWFTPNNLFRFLFRSLNAIEWFIVLRMQLRLDLFSKSQRRRRRRRLLESSRLKDWYGFYALQTSMAPLLFNFCFVYMGLIWKGILFSFNLFIACVNLYLFSPIIWIFKWQHLLCWWGSGSRIHVICFCGRSLYC